MKYIRELRMGRTKTFKTGAIVGTYPKPMLVLLFDQAGLDIIPTNPDTSMGMDITSKDIVYITPGTLGPWMANATGTQVAGSPFILPKVLAVNYFQGRKNPLEQELRAAVPDETMFINFVKDVDSLFTRKENPLFKTVVLDSVTGLQDLVFSFITSKNSDMLKDARSWAFQIGMKVKNTCAALTCLSCHIAVVMHTEVIKDEVRGTIDELPSVYSGLRNEIGAYFSQFFYSMLQANKPMVSTTDTGFVKGLGMRWPSGLPSVSGPTFKDLYGKEPGI